MTPEAAEAIRIADKHLAGQSVAERKALAMEILEAINNHAAAIAADAIREGIAAARRVR